MFKSARMRQVLILTILFYGMTSGAPVQAPNDDAIPEDQLMAWIKLGTQDFGYYDFDGKVSGSDTLIIGGRTIFYGMADSDVASLGGGSVKAIAAKYYHDHVDPIEEYGLDDNGASLGMMAESAKPFTITSDTLAAGAATSCTINAVYDGLIVLQEKQTDEYSAGQVDYMIEITNGTGDDAQALVAGDGDPFSYSGQLRIQDKLENDGVTHTYTIETPNTCVNVDFPDEADENYWHPDRGGEFLSIAVIDPGDPSSFTVVQGDIDAIPADVQAAITADYSDAGNKIYYVVFNKTTTFNANVGQTYWVTMDMQSAAQTSKSDNGDPDSFDGDDTVVVCDFSHTIAYSMDVAGAEVRTMVDIDNDSIFGAGNVEIDGAVLNWTDDADLDNSLELLNGNEVVVNTNTNTASVGAITGTGDLLKTGTGTLTLDTACTFTGDTTVEEGTLVINDAYASDVGITGGTLGGSGVLSGSLNLTGGSLAPGNSIGTITVGDFTLNGGTLEVEIDDDGNADKVIATNTTLTSGSVSLIPTEVISTERSYNIIESTNAIVGDPADLTKIDTSFVLDFDLALSGDSKNLILTTSLDNGFSDASAASGGGNTANVASVLQNAANNGQGGTTMMQLQQMNEQQLNETMQQLQPQTYQAASQVLGQQTNAVHTSTLGRISAVQFASRQSKIGNLDYALADAGDGLLGEAIRASSSLSQMRKGKWIGYMRSLNDWGKVDGDDNARGYRWETHGMEMGADTLVNENILVGGNISALWSGVNGFENSGSSEVTSLYGSLYGSWFTDKWHLDTGFTYGHAWTETRRPITNLGLRAEGDYESDIYSAFLGGGLFYNFKGYEIEPFLVYNYTLRSDGGLKETGAGVLNLDVQRNDTDSFRQTLGVRVSRLLKMDNGSTMRPFISAAWDYEYLNDNIAGSAKMLGSTFRNSSIEINRSSGIFSAGFDWYIKSNVSLFVDYTATVNSDLFLHSANGGFKIVF